MSDQWLEPFVIVDDAGAAVGTIQDDDAVVVFNFRADRVIEISELLAELPHSLGCMQLPTESA